MRFIDSSLWTWKWFDFSLNTTLFLVSKIPTLWFSSILFAFFQEWFPRHLLSLRDSSSNWICWMRCARKKVHLFDFSRCSLGRKVMNHKTKTVFVFFFDQILCSLLTTAQVNWSVGARHAQPVIDRFVSFMHCNTRKWERRVEAPPFDWETTQKDRQKSILIRA